MPIYARIENSRVAELLTLGGPIAGRFHPSLIWVECGGDVKEGSSFSDGVFTDPASLPKDPPPIPTVVNMKQARKALLAAGLLAQVDAAFASASKADQIDWEFSGTVERDNAVLISMATALGLDSAALDALFTAAAAL